MNLTPELLLTAYSQGMFPMAHEGGHIYWYSPDPRAILPLDRLHTSRSLFRLIHSGKYQVRFDTAFTAVVTACAAPGPGRETTWISDEIIEAYTLIHSLGFAHSVEVWSDEELVGGLYGVSLRGLFAGRACLAYCRIPARWRSTSWSVTCAHGDLHSLTCNTRPHIC